MQSLTHHVCHHSNVVVYAGHGQWWLARALGPPKKLVEQEGGQHTRLHNGNEWLMHNTEVVFVEDYENTTPWAERARHVLGARAGGVPVVDALPTVARVAARETSFSIRPTSNEMCTHFKWEAHEGEGDWKCAQGKCTKRHRSVYKLEALREPVGFKMVVPRQRMTRSQRQQRAPLQYLLSPATMQAIDNHIY